MSCKCCCTNTLDLCDQNICDGVDIGIAAQVPGVHRLVTYVLEQMVVLEAEFIFGEQIIFPLDNMMENYQFTAELFDPIGTKILIRKGNVDYDCFRFKTVIAATHSDVVIASS